MSKPIQLLIILIGMSIFNLSAAIYSEMLWTVNSSSGLLIKAAGFVGPALSSECTATRNPILESVCACLGDVPGGYCYHLSCGIVGVPAMAEQKNQIVVVHGDQG